MYTRSYLQIVGGIVAMATALLMSVGFCQDGPDKEAIKKKMALLMQGDDWEDKDAIAGFKEIVDLGAAAYPALAELLEATNEPVPVGNILSVFIESKGDKRIAVDATKKLLRREPAETDASVRIEAVNALAQIATTNDASALVPLMADPSEAVRVNVMRALSKLGTTNELVRIEEYLTLRKAQMSQSDLQKDQSFHEAQKALDSVKRRVAEIKPR